MSQFWNAAIIDTYSFKDSICQLMVSQILGYGHVLVQEISVSNQPIKVLFNQEYLWHPLIFGKKKNYGLLYFMKDRLKILL